MFYQVLHQLLAQVIRSFFLDKESLNYTLYNLSFNLNTISIAEKSKHDNITPAKNIQKNLNILKENY
jgi:hypothetical protein